MSCRCSLVSGLLFSGAIITLIEVWGWTMVESVGTRWFWVVWFELLGIFIVMVRFEVSCLIGI